jgi:hypothetical protein
MDIPPDMPAVMEIANPDGGRPSDLVLVSSEAAVLPLEPPELPARSRFADAGRARGVAAGLGRAEALPGAEDVPHHAGDNP